MGLTRATLAFFLQSRYLLEIRLPTFLVKDLSSIVCV